MKPVSENCLRAEVAAATLLRLCRPWLCLTCGRRVRRGLRLCGRAGRGLWLGTLDGSGTGDVWISGTGRECEKCVTCSCGTLSLARLVVMRVVHVALCLDKKKNTAC